MTRFFSKLKYFTPTLFMALPLLSLAYTDLPPGTAVTFSEIDSLVRLVMDFMIGIGGVLMVIFIVISGIMTMSAGADSAKFKDGMLRLKHAAIGAGVVLAAGVIINTVYALVDRSFFCQLSVVGVCLF